MAKKIVTSVADYLSTLPDERRTLISKVRALILKHLPNGYEEGFEYGTITYQIPLTAGPATYNGKPLCYAALASHKNYCTLYLMAPYGNPKLRAELEDGFKKAGKKLDMGKSCVHFKSMDDLPVAVIAKSIASVAAAKYIKAYNDSRKKPAKQTKS
jgi:hypothetical protein